MKLSLIVFSVYAFCAAGSVGGLVSYFPMVTIIYVRISFSKSNKMNMRISHRKVVS